MIQFRDDRHRTRWINNLADDCTRAIQADSVFCKRAMIEWTPMALVVITMKCVVGDKVSIEEATGEVLAIKDGVALVGYNAIELLAALGRM